MKSRLPMEEQVAAVQMRLAQEWGCDPAAFSSDDNVFIPSESCVFEVLTFGRSAVFRAREPMLRWCREAFADTEACWILDSGNLYRIESQLRLQKAQLCGEHMRYLQSMTLPLPAGPDGLTYEWKRGAEVLSLYEHTFFQNALGFSGRDVIALSAYDGEALVAMAAADDNLEPLWQIGIDTLPGYRRRGLAAYLVSALAEAIWQEGRIPFYTTWGANLASTRVALGSGFRPAWLGYHTEMTEADSKQ